MANFIRKAGVFQLSIPVGIDRGEFNANHIFDPRAIVNLASGNSLELSSLTVIRQGDKVEELAPVESQLSELATQRYALGILEFRKRLEL